MDYFLSQHDLIFPIFSFQQRSDSISQGMSTWQPPPGPSSCTTTMDDRNGLVVISITKSFSIETDPKKPKQNQNLINNKKSTVFELSSRNFFKMTS